jgi:hypothetical protein
VLVASTASLVLFVSLAPQRDDATTVGGLLVAAGVAGSALYAIGAAVWTGTTAYRLREVGWILTAFAFGIPSTLTLALPLVGVLAFPVVPISRHTPAQTRNAAA